MMKRTISLLLLVCFIFSMFTGCSVQSGGESGPTLRISGAWALYPMMLVWAEEYMKTNDILLEVSGGGAGKGISDVLSNQVDIGMVSRPIKEEELEQGAFYVSVTRDTVLAVINENNPVYQDIVEKGLSREDLRRIFMKEVTNWGDLFGREIAGGDITIYGRSDSSGAASVWAAFLGGYTEADLQNHSDSNVSGDQAIANSVQGDANAISFTNMNYIFNVETGGYVQSIRPVPIDLNEDDKINEGEDFYGNRNDFLKKVSEGVYPSPPTRNEYLVSNGPFTGEALNFVNWILDAGQEFLEQNGYVRLSEQERVQELELLEKGFRE